MLPSPPTLPSPVPSPSETLFSPDCILQGRFQHSNFFSQQVALAAFPLFTALAVSLFWAVHGWKQRRRAKQLPGLHPATTSVANSPVAALSQGGTAGVRHAVSRSPGGAADGATMRTRDKIAMALVVLFYTMHPFLTRRSLLLFHCRTFQSEVVDADSGAVSVESYSLLSQDLSVDCRDGGTVAWMLILGVPMLVVYVRPWPHSLRLAGGRSHTCGADDTPQLCDRGTRGAAAHAADTSERPDPH